MRIKDTITDFPKNVREIIALFRRYNIRVKNIESNYIEIVHANSEYKIAFNKSFNEMTDEEIEEVKNYLEKFIERIILGLKTW